MKLKFPRWKENKVTEPSFIERTTVDLIDFIIANILSDCFLTIDEKTSLSRRKVVYEKSLVKECREFQAIFPDHFPPENNDCIFQTIPIGLFFETFGQKADLTDTEKVVEISEQTAEIRMKGNICVDVSNRKTDGFLAEPCQQQLTIENTEELKGKLSFIEMKK